MLCTADVMWWAGPCAGEAFDKAARMLNLEARPSGGAALEALALQGDPRRIPFPVPLAKRHDCSFSYAGLKTSVLRAISGAALGEACDANLQVSRGNESPSLVWPAGPLLQ